MVHGEGAVALALSLHFEVRARIARAEPTRVNGRPLDRRHHAYFLEAIAREWGNRGPLELATRSTLPSSSGLGSSAALTVATVGALRLMRGKLDPEEVARASFDVEYAVQGRASPTDTSVSSHGRALYIAPQPSDGHLWTIERDGKRWCIHDLAFPPMDFVVGFTGKKGNTGELVEGVRQRMESSEEARGHIRAIGGIVERARAALAGGQRRAVGALMDENQEHLAALGVSSPALERLIDAARPHALGAKLTGAGVGGCMIALTEDLDACAAAVEAVGGQAFRVTPDTRGVCAL